MLRRGRTPDSHWCAETSDSALAKQFQRIRCMTIKILVNGQPEMVRKRSSRYSSPVSIQPKGGTLNIEDLICILALVAVIVLRDVFAHHREMAKVRIETDRNRVLPRAVGERER